MLHGLSRSTPHKRLVLMTALSAAPAGPKEEPTIWRVDDVLWACLAPLLVDKPRKKSGRPRTDDRPPFDGALWMIRTGAGVEDDAPRVRTDIHRPRYSRVAGGAVPLPSPGLLAVRGDPGGDRAGA